MDLDGNLTNQIVSYFTNKKRAPNHSGKGPDQLVHIDKMGCFYIYPSWVFFYLIFLSNKIIFIVAIFWASSKPSKLFPIDQTIKL